MLLDHEFVLFYSVFYRFAEMKSQLVGRFDAINAATVMRLRSRGDNSFRCQMSSKSTRSVSSTNLGAKLPINCCAAFEFLLKVVTPSDLTAVLDTA